MGNIPHFTPTTAEEMNLWFLQMYNAGLLYHPDDAAETILLTRDGSRLFSDAEAAVLNGMLAAMFARFGNQVYDAAWQYAECSLHNARVEPVACG